MYMKTNEISKIYNHREVEDKIYEEWENSGFFSPAFETNSVLAKLRFGKQYKKKKKVPYFSIVMPPPNVTGTLHIGHALTLTLEDIMVRYHRMKGDDTLWLPGTDHAAIATQTKVEKLLREREGKSRYDLGREKFLEEVEKFVEQSKSTIHKQIRKMGASCDWSREAYTLDEVRSRAVREVFKRMYDDGLIYRGTRIVNWCPRCASTLADDEVEYVEQDAKLYTFRYSKDFPISISTTRPETKLGDTAVAVNPADKRYKNLIGKEFDIDFVGQPLHLKIIADKGVDMGFGTGAVGVTPAHSFIDYEMAQKNKLKLIQIINEKGKIINAPNYQDLTVSEAREKIVEELKKQGLLDKEEIIKHNLSVCYRCGAPIEPLPSKQWFISVSSKFKIKNSKLKGFKKGEKVSLKELALSVVKNGQIKIIPQRFEKVYYHWLNNLRDWCISRQIWFGHQIPVWYKNNEIFVGVDAPEGEGWKQETDTLDTWFSSALWTFSTLLNKDFKKYKNFNEWLQDSPDLKRFHPISVMETGYDILFFWVARMILMTTYVLGDIPFKTVYLHGLVRDEKGRKMSKSLGNIIDPLDVSEKYGTDAVRLSLVLGTTPGNDLMLSEDKIAGFRNFTNKLWNIGRYIISLPSDENNKISNYKIQISKLALADKWILSRLNRMIQEVTDDLENFRFSQTGEKLRSFTWDEFADWYIEINKIQPNPKLITSIFKSLICLWHPFMPFVTEALWKELKEKDLLIIANWPKANKRLINQKAEKDFQFIQDIIKAVRNLRAEFKIDPSKFVNVLIISKEASLIKKESEIIKRLGRVGSLEISKIGRKPKNSATAVVKSSEIYLLLEGLVNIEKEKERIKKELEEATQYLTVIINKLNNKNFINRAPKEIVITEKNKYKELKERIKKLQEYLKNL